MPLTFEERLEKHVRGRNSEQIDWAKRGESWKARVSDLISSIEAWLGPAVKAGLLVVVRSKKEITEQFIGDYVADSLTIWAGDQQLHVVPRGTLILGSHGRVDVKGPNGDSMLILEYAGEMSTPSWKRVDDAMWFVWAVDERRQMHPLSDETFKVLVERAFGV